MCCYSPDMLYRTFRGFGRKYPKWAVAGFTPNSKWTKNNDLEYLRQSKAF